MHDRSLELLCKHYDLLPPDQQAVARWVCEDWAINQTPVPKWLQSRFGQSFHFQLDQNDAPKIARYLTLELLSKHKQEILKRQRPEEECGYVEKLVSDLKSLFKRSQSSPNAESITEEVISREIDEHTNVK